MRWLFLLFAFPALAHETGTNHTHGFFTPLEYAQPPVEPELPPVKPPIEPPPELPPSNPDARLYWEEQCEKTDTLACWTADSPTDVYEASNMPGGEWTGVPNSPNHPLTNGKCAWNSPPGVQPCHPAYGSAAPPAARNVPRVTEDPVSWTCGTRQEQLRDYGYSQRDAFAASLLSPCYSVEAQAAVLTDWARLGSSINHLGTANLGAGRTLDVFELEYEIYIHESMFRARKGSSTAKLHRVYQSKAEWCWDDRMTDERFLAISETSVTLGFVAYCQTGGYVPDEANYEVLSDYSGWLRVRRVFDHQANTITSTVTDVASGVVLQQHTLTTDRNGNPLQLAGPWTLRSARFLNHSTSHQACDADCDQYEDGHYAVRHVRMAGH